MEGVAACRTTGIYCQPSCAARPHPANVRTFPLPAAAETEGFRACHRCRPYRVDFPPTVTTTRVVCDALRLISLGALDDGTEQTLADRLGISARHLRRLFLDDLGATPDAIARAQRAHFARRLLDDTDLSVTDIAFAAGFGSLRQCHRTLQTLFGEPPTRLRARRRRADHLAVDGGLPLRLATPPDYDFPDVLRQLAAGRIAGVEQVTASHYRRVVRMEGDPGVVEVSRRSPHELLLVVHPPRLDRLLHHVHRVRGMIGLEPSDLGLGAWDTAEARLRTALTVDGRPDLPALATYAATRATRVDGLTALGLDRMLPVDDHVVATT